MAGCTIICPIALHSNFVGGGVSGCVYMIDKDVVLKDFNIYAHPQDNVSAKELYQYAFHTLESVNATTKERRVYRLLEERNQHQNIAEAIAIYPEGIYLRRYKALSHPGTIPQSDRMRLYRDILQGLSHLHELRVAHGDIRVSNILQNPRGQAVICDFSEACTFGTLVSGPPDPTIWLPRGGPAQVLSDGTDRFAMATLIYEMETGQETDVRLYVNSEGKVDLPYISFGRNDIELVVKKGWAGSYTSTTEMLTDVNSAITSYQQDPVTLHDEEVPRAELRGCVERWRVDRRKRWGRVQIEELHEY